MIGKVQVTSTGPEAFDPTLESFRECETCWGWDRSGSERRLCDACIHNRAVINGLQKIVAKQDELIVALKSKLGNDDELIAILRGKGYEVTDPHESPRFSDER